MSSVDGKVLAYLPIGPSVGAVKIDDGQAFASTAGSQLFVRGETSLEDSLSCRQSKRVMAPEPWVWIPPGYGV